MPKKPAKLSEKEQREIVVDLLTKINAEGGPAEYFTGYSSPEGMKGFCPFVPDSLVKVAEEFCAAHTKLKNALNLFRESFDIDEEEVEY